MGVIDASTKDTLQKQVDDYGANPDNTCLSSQGLALLYQGTDSYQALYESKVRAYRNAYSIEKNEGSEAKEYTFFRKQFIEYLSTHNISQCSIDDSIKSTNPEKATLSMKELLGPRGVALYHLALEEEFNSQQYRKALVIKSTTQSEGPKWKERPVLIIAGPSGSGKSRAASEAMNYINRFLPIEANSSEQNHIITVDGGIAREVCQMRKLVIQLANNQGYSGISDLQPQSSILDKIRPRVRDAAFASSGVGVVIPETFSSWLNVIHPVRNLMKIIGGLQQTKQIFLRVQGQDPNSFQSTVAFMGSRRAWKTSGFDKNPIPLNLNQEGLTESKAYNPHGFLFGDKGSKFAEQWYKAHSRDKLNMLIINDLILLKPAPDQGELMQEWIVAKQGDEGAQLFSNSAYQTCLKDCIEKRIKGEQPSALDEYCKKNAVIKIETCAKIDYAIGRREFQQRITLLEQSSNKTLSLNPKSAKLREFLMKLPEDLPDEVADINELKKTVSKLIDSIKQEKGGNWKRLFFSKTLVELNKLYKALDNALIISEIKPEPTAHAKKDLAKLKEENINPLFPDADKESFVERHSPRE